MKASWEIRTQLTPYFLLSPGAFATVDDTIQISEIHTRDFSDSIRYVVTAQDSITVQEWLVAVNILPDPLDLDEFEGVRIYPNPTTNRINISGIEGEYAIQLLNLSGQIIYNSKNERFIDLSDFSTGIYLLKIQIENRNTQT